MCGQFSSAQTCHACSLRTIATERGDLLNLQVDYSALELRTLAGLGVTRADVTAAQAAQERTRRRPRGSTPASRPGTQDRFWELVEEEGLTFSSQTQVGMYRLLQRFMGEYHEAHQAELNVMMERLREASRSRNDGFEVYGETEEDIPPKPKPPPPPRISAWDRIRNVTWEDP